MKHIYYCPDCKSEDVMVSAWTDPNKDNEYVEQHPVEDYWCNNCDCLVKTLNVRTIEIEDEQD